MAGKSVDARGGYGAHGRLGKTSAPGRILVLAAGLALWAAQAQAALSVGRAAFARGVVAREPVGVSDTFPADVGEVYFFTHVLGAEEPTEILHVWIHNGWEMAIVPLEVQSPSWRTWSSKRILPEWTGEWTVEVRETDGTVIYRASFRIE